VELIHALHEGSENLCHRRPEQSWQKDTGDGYGYRYRDRKGKSMHDNDFGMVLFLEVLFHQIDTTN